MRSMQKYWPLAALVVATVLLTLTPIIHSKIFIGDQWRGIAQTYGDEILYHAQIVSIAHKNIALGNPYALEHVEDSPLVLFGGSWLAAIPLFFGLSLTNTLYINFAIWSVFLVLLTYWLFREFGLPRWFSSFAALLSYLPHMDIMFRPSSRQQVEPFFVLLFVALTRFINHQSKGNTIFLGIASGLTFWVFSYLWQSAIVMLGLLFLYALYTKDRDLVKGTLVASVIAGIIGSPTILYMLWQARNPIFWESIARFGLVNSHLPAAEVVYSGGWVGVIVTFLAVVYWRTPAIRTREFRLVFLFVAVTGLGFWIIQGSNLITGKMLETAEHIRRFIVPWLTIATALSLYALWHHRHELKGYIRFAVYLGCGALLLANAYFFYLYPYRFMFKNISPEIWKTQQLFAAPVSWLDQKQKDPVVVFGDSHDFVLLHVPVYSKHYTLFEDAMQFTYMSNEELQERYLVSEYFKNPDIAFLKQDLATYVGRGDAYHHAKTVERGIKICRILKFWDKNSCGAIPTSQELMGEAFFNNLETKFQTQIRPNIKQYLAKYHVSYIIKDKTLEPEIRPQTLGATKVYDDGRFELWHI